MTPAPLEVALSTHRTGGDERGLRDAYEAARVAVQRAHGDSARLVRMLSVIGAPGTSAELVTSTLEALSELFDADLVLAVRQGAGGAVVEQALGSGDGPLPALPVLPGAALFDGAARAAPWTLPPGVPAPVVAGVEVRSAVWLPLDPGPANGSAILVLRSDPADFHRGETELLSSVAARLRSSLEERERREAIARVADAGPRLSRQLQEQELMDEAAAVLVEVTGGSSAAVVQVVDGAAVLRAHLPAVGAPSGRSLAPARSWSGAARDLAVWREASQGRTVVTAPRGTAASLLAPRPPGLLPPLPDDETLVCVPVMAGGEVVALLWVSHHGTGLSVAATAETVGILAGYVAAAMVNTTLYRALSESEGRLRMLTESINDLVIVLTAEGTVTYASPSHAREIGVPPEAVVGQRAFDQVHPDDRAALAAAFATAVRAGPGSSATPHLELRVLTGDRTWAWVECSLACPPGGSGEVVVVARLIGDRRRLRDELERRATHDPLTSLPNRDLVREALDAELASSAAGGVGLLFVDLDRFKPVNDRLGHEAGDDLLRQVAGRLRGCVRPGDLVARLGGDEFVVVVPGASGPEAVGEVGEQVLAALTLPFPLAGEQVEIGASIGGVLGLRAGAGGTGQASPGALLRDADAAMYEAKARGRGRVHVARAPTGVQDPPA